MDCTYCLCGIVYTYAVCCTIDNHRDIFNIIPHYKPTAYKAFFVCLSPKKVNNCVKQATDLGYTYIAFIIFGGCLSSITYISESHMCIVEWYWETVD